MTEAQLRALVALAPASELRTPPLNGHAPHVSNVAVYDVPALLQATGIHYQLRDKAWGRVYELDICLSSDDHTEGAAILQFGNGAVAYKCQHNSCAHVGWSHVKPRLGIAARTAERGDRSPIDQESGGRGSTWEPRQRSAAQPSTPESTRARGAAPQGVRFMTAREFAQLTPEETDWVIQLYVAVGGITKIDGPPKKAGKTTLITHMIAAVLDGAAFLGEPTKQGPVVLLSEQGGTSLREALDRAGLLERDDLHLALYRDLASLSWPDIVADAFAKAQEVGAVLLVVDTLPAISGVRGDDENSAGRALEALEPLQVGADISRIGVVVSFHDRKGGGEVGESGRGSSAYAGAVDIILHVNKPGGNLKPTVRKIEALSRFEATPDELYIDLTDAGYVSLGSEDDVVSAALARALVEILPDMEAAARRVETTTEKDKETGEERVTERGLLDDLASQGLKVSRFTLDAELKRWVAGGYAGQSGAGKKGSPHRYWMTAKPPDTFFRSKPSPPSEERICPDPVADAERVIVAEDPTLFLSSDEGRASEKKCRDRQCRRGSANSFFSDAVVGYIGSKQPTPPAAGTTWEDFDGRRRAPRRIRCSRHPTPP